MASTIAGVLKASMATAGWNLLDLSYDRVVTNKLRVQLTNPNQLKQIGGIGELKVLGEGGADLLERLEPVSVTTNRLAETGRGPETLFDHNTYSGWWMYAAINPEADATADLGETCTIGRIKIFSGDKQDRNGIFWWDCPFKVQYLKNGAWVNIPGMDNLEVHKLGAVWTSFDLSKYNISTSQIRVAINSILWTGGIREVEIWGHKTVPTSSHYLQISQTPALVTNTIPANYSFNLTTIGNPVSLHIATEGDPTLPLKLELNGQTAVNLSPVATIRGLNIYQLKLDSSNLWTGANFLRILGNNLTVRDLRLETSSRSWFEAPGTVLTDRFELTPVAGGDTIIDLGNTCHLDDLVLKYLGSYPSVQIAVDSYGSWVSFTGTPQNNLTPVGGELTYSNIGLVKRMKISTTNTGDSGPTEAIIHGSKINAGNPQVKITAPQNGACMELSDWLKTSLTGTVDNPEDQVTVNAIPATVTGTTFSIPLSMLGLESGDDIPIQVVATDPKGQKGTD